MHCTGNAAAMVAEIAILNCMLCVTLDLRPIKERKIRILALAGRCNILQYAAIINALWLISSLRKSSRISVEPVGRG